MSLLRIYGQLSDQPQHCQWALISDIGEPVTGEGQLTDLPQRVGRVQLVIPAAQVLITRARVPHGARRNAGSVLAFAVEEKTAGEPDANQVSWLGAIGDEDVLAVVDKAGLERWQHSLGAIGIRIDEVHCETLMLPVCEGEWSIAWNGSDGLVRTGEFEGAATDCGDRESPPFSLRLMLEEAQIRSAGPTSIALYTTTPNAAPDIAAWQRELGIELRTAGIWDWRTAPPDAGINLVQQRKRWRIFPGMAIRLRAAAWILGAALALHAIALVTGWTLLASEQRTLRQQMEARFRAAFPEAVAVVDPVLQMRRKLAEARHAAGQSDSGDFLPMIEQVALAAKESPVGAVRTVSYEGGRMTLELSTNDEAVRRIVARLIQSGLSVEMLKDTSAASSKVPARAANAKAVLIVRAS
ncbi:MAG: type II secretion system protein GspL [Gallionella sp.]|nr:type II secretion system protein GspL [Gallionella sp.]